MLICFFLWSRFLHWVVKHSWLQCIITQYVIYGSLWLGFLFLPILSSLGSPVVHLYFSRLGLPFTTCDIGYILQTVCLSNPCITFRESFPHFLLYLCLTTTLLYKLGKALRFCKDIIGKALLELHRVWLSICIKAHRSKVFWYKHQS